MDDLQDAIEDAQYVNAISSHGILLPSSKWETPSEDDIIEWKARKVNEVAAGDDEAFSPEWFMAQPIGFYLVAQFVKNTHDDYERFNFLEDVIRFKKVIERLRSEKAKKIVDNYLTPVCLVDQRRKKEIETYDIARGKSTIPKERIKELIENNISTSSNMTRIGIGGPLVEEAIQKATEETIVNDEKIPVIPDENIFDSLEAIVFHTVISKYWDEFLQSREYERCMNFLWYQDRTIVEEDFFNIRVLGRGGFGLVSGV